jgi:hypothetical protein
MNEHPTPVLADLARIRNLLLQFYPPATAEHWLTVKHPLLGDKTPLRVIEEGNARWIEHILRRRSMTLSPDSMKEIVEVISDLTNNYISAEAKGRVDGALIARAHEVIKHLTYGNDPTVTVDRQKMNLEERTIIEKLRINAFLLLLRQSGGAFMFDKQEMETVRGHIAVFSQKNGNYRFDLTRRQ